MMRILWISIACLVASVVLWALTPDCDDDGLPDLPERVYGSDIKLYDSDGDGFSDQLEWLNRTRPDNDQSFPQNLPDQIRAIAWQSADGAPIQVYVGVYPAALIDTVQIVMGSRTLPGPDPDFNVVDVVPALKHIQTHSDGSAGFSFVLPGNDLLATHQSLALGVVAGVDSATAVTDSFSLLDSPGDAGLIHMLHNVGGLLFPMITSMNPFRTFSAPKSFDEPEYCQLSIGAGSPLGLAGLKFKVEDAGCAPAGLTICVGIECEAMSGREIIEVDRGFLQDRMD